MPDLKHTDDVYADFMRHADEFAASCMAGYVPQRFSQNKVIHDCVWGTVMFYPWELSIIDSPLIQRLRRINQLGLAVLTYPSAHHSRFEHTLGVVAVVSRMVASVNQDDNEGLPGQERIIPPSDVRRLRLAALLHDVGHCFFSHLSETIYGVSDEMRRLKASDPVFAGAQPHEILGYMIINTPSFIRFFSSLEDYPFDDEEPERVLDEVGRMIVGAMPRPRPAATGGLERPCYLTEMINGQFDADALDYLRRDSYATGLALTYHIDRFLYKLRIAGRRGDDGITEKHMTVPVSGISTVEEMVFSKLMLTRYIYQHQKVLAVESMLGDLVAGMQAKGRLLHPCDFLKLCDSDIYSLGSRFSDEALRPAAAAWRLAPGTERTVGDIAERVLLRRLPKKALILTPGMIRSLGGCECTGDDGTPAPPDAAGLADYLNKIPDLRGEIVGKAAEYARTLALPPPELYDVYVAVPRVSTAKNFSRTPVLTYDGNFIPMSDVVDLNDWAGAFSGHSYNAYVFAEPESLPAVSAAALTVLGAHGIVFDRAKVFSGLKESVRIEAACAMLRI